MESSKTQDCQSNLEESNKAGGLTLQTLDNTTKLQELKLCGGIGTKIDTEINGTE